MMACLFAASASAITVPLKGWTPIEGDTTHWHDASGQCLIKEEKHNLPFTKLTSQDLALKFSKSLRDALEQNQEKKIKIKKVTTQVIKHENSWAVLAAYLEMTGQETTRVWQIYLSDNKKLKTITGSVHHIERGSCVNQMREFIRYKAR